MMFAQVAVYITIVGSCLLPGQIDKRIEIHIVPRDAFVLAHKLAGLDNAQAFAIRRPNECIIYLSNDNLHGLCHELLHCMGWDKGRGH